MIRLFLTVLRMGLVSGYAVLIVLLVRMLLRRFPKRYSYLLWSAVLLRLVCPVMIKSPFSLVPDALSLSIIRILSIIPVLFYNIVDDEREKMFEELKKTRNSTD